RSVPALRWAARPIDSEHRTLRILHHGESAGPRNVRGGMDDGAAERRGQSRGLVHVVGFHVEHPVGRNTFLALLRTESEDAPYRHALARPHGVVLVELLRSPSGDGWIEFPRC